jgi:hypothetical protein
VLGSKTRFRAVMMTSFAFIFGVYPLVVAQAAAEISRHGVGTPVFAAMIAASAVIQPSHHDGTGRDVRLLKPIQNSLQPGPRAAVVQPRTGRATCPDRAHDFIPELYDNTSAKKQHVRQL